MSIRIGRLADIPRIRAIEQIPEYRKYIGCWNAEEHRSAMEGEDAEYLVATSGEVLAAFCHPAGHSLGASFRSAEAHRGQRAEPRPRAGAAPLCYRSRLPASWRAPVWLDVFVTNARAPGVSTRAAAFVKMACYVTRSCAMASFTVRC